MEQHGTEAALLPNIANQMRSLLSNLYLAASQVIPPEQREQDPALDAKAAILEQSFFRLLRLVNSMSAAEYLSDSQTLSLRDADLVKLVSEVCESSADLAEQLGIQLKFVCAMDRRVCAIHPAAVEQMLYHLLSIPSVSSRRTRSSAATPNLRAKPWAALVVLPSASKAMFAAGPRLTS